jgi:hypothetical protein
VLLLPHCSSCVAFLALQLLHHSFRIAIFASLLSHCSSHVALFVLQLSCHSSRITTYVRFFSRCNSRIALRTLPLSRCSAMHVVLFVLQLFSNRCSSCTIFLKFLLT